MYIFVYISVYFYSHHKNKLVPTNIWALHPDILKAFLYVRLPHPSSHLSSCFPCWTINTASQTVVPLNSPFILLEMKMNALEKIRQTVMDFTEIIGMRHATWTLEAEWLDWKELRTELPATPHWVIALKQGLDSKLSGWSCCFPGSW